MLYFSEDGQYCIERLFYYPYTFGKHFARALRDAKFINDKLSSLPATIGTVEKSIPHIGTVRYISDGVDTRILHISWSSDLTRFYYTKSNFITFTAKGNIPSVHPNFYTLRNETSLKCDNDYMVVSRKYKGKEVFNFIDTSKGFIRLISDIDFTQVLPFSKHKDMTARGYTPDRRCWMVFEDGNRIEVNEAKRIDKPNLIRLTESQLKQVIAESVRTCLRRLI